MAFQDRFLRPATRRGALKQLGAAGVALASGPAWGQTVTTLPLPGGPGERDLTDAFPEKGRMILQRTRPPMLETPFEVFDQGVFTPNDLFFVRWHWAVIPTDINVDSYSLSVHGHVAKPLTLSLKQIMSLPRTELAAVNQCSGNSRGYFQPRVAGGEWSNGAMGNAKWMGVRLKDVLDLAGVKPGAVRVRFAGGDDPVVADAPKFMKSLDIDHARDGEVLIAYGMNGAQMPLLNGFPIRLIVPGWYSTYWVKMLNSIEVLDGADDNFWMTTAYRIPDTPGANIRPGETGIPTVPINRMVPRSFITNLHEGATVRAGEDTPVRGIAFGGSTGVRAVDLSTDGGMSWKPAELGRDEGKYGFRQWSTSLRAPAGNLAVMVRCTNTDGLQQPVAPNWNPSGFMRNVIETTQLRAVKAS